MRGALVTVGGPLLPNLTVANREKITYLVWEARDPQLTPSLLQWARDHGLRVLTMRDPTWPTQYEGATANDTAEELGQKLSDDIERLGGGKAGEPAKAQLASKPDIEHVHDADYVMTCYEKFRSLRSGRGFYLSLEWHQTAWFSQELIDAINNDPLFFLCPQAYETSKMVPVDPRVVVQDCIDHGINKNKVQVDLRNDRMDIGWEGCIFNYNEAR